jgi:hypothetical protein
VSLRAVSELLTAWQSPLLFLAQKLPNQSFVCIYRNFNQNLNYYGTHLEEEPPTVFYSFTYTHLVWKVVQQKRGQCHCEPGALRRACLHLSGIRGWQSPLLLLFLPQKLSNRSFECIFRNLSPSLNYCDTPLEEEPPAVFCSFTLTHLEWKVGQRRRATGEFLDNQIKLDIICLNLLFTTLVKKTRVI